MTKNRFTYVLCIMVLILCVAISGCTKENTDAVNTKQTEQSKTDATDTSKDAASEFTEITDMAGRTVKVPSKISKVFSTSSTGTIAVYTLDPSFLIGWNYDLNDAEKAYILPEYQALPSFGQGSKVNYESLIKAKPDICISFSKLTDTAKTDADALQAQINIPVVIIDGSLANTVEMYTFLGTLLNKQAEAEKLCAYAEKALNFAKTLEEGKSKKIYYGNGEDSLETSPVGSPHAELFELVKANNVAVVAEAPAARVNISAEQLISWNPDIIIVNGEPKSNYSSSAAGEDILKNPNYKTITAIKEGNVYGIPKYPFSWFDRPPASNRIIGIMWLSNILYPEKCDFDIKDEVKEFYNLYYHLELTDAQLTDLLGKDK